MNEGRDSVLEGAEVSGGEVVKKDGGIRSSVEKTVLHWPAACTTVSRSMYDVYYHLSWEGPTIYL